MADPYTYIIRPATPLDYQAIVNTVNALNPEWPPLTVQRLEADRASLPADSFLEPYVAERDGQVIGDAFWHRLPYIDEQSIYWFTTRIHPDKWGRMMKPSSTSFIGWTVRRPRTCRAPRRHQPSRLISGTRMCSSGRKPRRLIRARPVSIPRTLNHANPTPHLP